MAARKTPPFRADHVGSLLRPPAVRAARDKHERGEISAAALKEVEDKAISADIDKLLEIGIQSVTDGEIRRTSWHRDFVMHLAGMEWDPEFAKEDTRRVAQRAGGKVSFTKDHPFLEHFRFVRDHAQKAKGGGVPKMTIPSPTTFVPLMAESPRSSVPVANIIAPVVMDWRKIVHTDAYKNLDEFYADVIQAYRDAIKAFYDEGCRYLQIDEVRLVLLCDPSHQKALTEAGADADKVIQRCVDLLAGLSKDHPKDMVLAMHNCRGNYQSQHFGSGGYDKVADLMFNTTDIDAYFMEYDDSRSGGFEPLRFLPKGKTATLGIFTSKRPQLESKDDIKRRIDEASKYASLDQLCISPQCGFASTLEGNALTEAEQWRKLAWVKEIADEVWGS